MEHGFFHPDRGYWQAIGGEADDLLPTYPEGTIQVPLKPSSDHEWQDGQWIYVEPEPIPEPVPRIISKRQFYDGLVEVGKITKGQALAAMTSGTLPPAIQAIVDGMEDDDAKYKATMLLVGATEFDRDNPLVMIFAINEGMSEEDVDDFWRLCATL